MKTRIINLTFLLKLDKISYTLKNKFMKEIDFTPVVQCVATIIMTHWKSESLMKMQKKYQFIIFILFFLYFCNLEKIHGYEEIYRTDTDRRADALEHRVRQGREGRNSGGACHWQHSATGVADSTVLTTIHHGISYSQTHILWVE